MMRPAPNALLLALLALAPCTAPAQEFTDQELRGKRIYVDGESDSGRPITAVVARGGSPIPASILPCSGCHGEDGKGRPEGGVVPTDIAWDTLTASYGHQHSYGRSHPAYDEVSIAKAIIVGVDPAGNELDVAMPRYDMAEEDMADLVAYLKRIKDDLDPGLTPDIVRVGSLLPVTGRNAAAGEAMRRVLEASFADINAAGGIHGRRLELVVAEAGDDPVENVWAARDLLQRGEVFAMVSGYGIGMEAQLAELAEEVEVPMIGLYTQLPRAGDGLSRHSFYLTGGLAEQSAVLVRGSSGRVAILHPPAEVYRAGIDAAKRELDERSARALVITWQPPYLDVVDYVETLEREAVDAVLFYGPANELRRLANQAAAADYAPDLLLPGVFAGSELFDIKPDFRGKVLVGYSSIPADHTPEGVREFESLHQRHGFGFEQSTAQISAFVAARVFAEALKRGGRSLSREKLLIALEGLTDFRSGLMPPISYNRSRRIGAYGGYVLPVDVGAGRFGPPGNWISLAL